MSSRSSIIQDQQIMWAVDGNRYALRVGDDSSEFATENGQIITLRNRDLIAFSHIISKYIPAEDAPSGRREMKTRPNYGKKWEAEQDDELIHLWQDGATVSEIALKLGRNRGGVVARIVYVGLAPNTESVNREDRARRSTATV